MIKERTRVAIPVSIGAYCHDLRYDEHEHASHLPKEFDRAKEAWIASGNDPKSPQYQRACELRAPIFECNYKITYKISASLNLDQDNRISGVGDVESDESGLAASSVFVETPTLKAFHVVSVDFRSNTSIHPLREGEKMSVCPEVGLVAVFEAKVSSFTSDEEFSQWVLAEGTSLNENYEFQMVGGVLETSEVDEDGFETTSSSSSWSGGDAIVEAGAGGSVQSFIHKLSGKVWKERETPELLGENVPELRRVLLLADEKMLTNKLDAGLDVDSMVEDDPILKLALMFAATAETWFTGAETGDELGKRFEALSDYQAALKKNIIELLDRGANVNAGEGLHSIIGIASALGDPEVLERCMYDVDSADDANALPFLAAAENGDIEMIKAMLTKGARINKREIMHGTTALMLACQGPGGEDEPPLSGEELERHEKTVAFLIENGAEVDAVSHGGDTAIGNAVKRGNTTIVKMLLDQDANVSDVLPAGQPLIEAARQRGHEAIVQLLSEHGPIKGDGGDSSNEQTTGATARAEKSPVNYMPDQADLDLDVDVHSASLSDDDFDDRWNRLIDNQNKISDNFIDELAEFQDQQTQEEYDTLMSYIEEMNDQNRYINEIIDTATNRDLGHYAKTIKNVALVTLGLCQKYRVFNDVDTYGYDTGEKTIQINGEDFYYLD